MPLRLVQSANTPELWRAMVGRFLDEVSKRTGPSGYPAHLWLRDRRQRDSLLEAAQRRGCPGWLGTPVSFWTDLPSMFDIRVRTIGLLTRRALISRIAREVGTASGFGDPRRGPAIVRGHMLDRILSDLLPENVGPEQLSRALEGLATDDFARRRNDWVVGTYRAYLEALEAMDRVDPRSIPALLAAAIDRGALPFAVRSADRLHVYGLLFDLRSRRKLVRALMGQTEVDVVVYSLSEPEPGPWDVLDVPTEGIAATPTPIPGVQPAPDGSIEAGWVAAQVKRIVVEQECEPHEIAVVARSGREDTRRIGVALSDAGVPVSVRARASLSQVSALKAFLGLFEGAAQDWAYRPFRACVTSPYFDMGVRPRTLDRLASASRVHGLADWREAVNGLLARATADSKVLGGTGLFLDHLENDLQALGALEVDLAWLTEQRTERAWVERTLSWLRQGPFGFRERSCVPVGEDWDVVRFDQRGVLQLERLLREWFDLADDRNAIWPADWYRLLHRLLSGSELALSSPNDKGVQVLEAQDATLTPFRHLFLVHANHGEFPRDARSGGVFSDEERARLAEQGLPILDNADHARRERALWRAVTSAPHVTVLYRTTSFQGTPLLPSLMVPEHDRGQELPRTRLSRWAAVTAGQHRRQAARALAEESDPARGIAIERSERLRHSVLVAHAEAQRPGTDPPSDDHPGLSPHPWNGGLSDPEVLEHLAREFGSSRVWSASQLEAYGTCPFNFLIRRVLELGESEQVEEETTPLTFGSVAHEILERFYSEVKAALPSTFDGPTQLILNRATKEVLRERESSEEWLGDPVLWRNTSAEIEEVVRDYVAWEVEHMAAKGERPVEVEFAFGLDGEDVAELSGPDRSGAMHTIRLRGRIDRIDVAHRRGAKIHLVLDYKSTRTPAAKGYRDGSLVQAPLYVEVIRNFGYQGQEGRYRALRRPGNPQNGAAARVGKEVYDVAIAHAMSIPVRVRAGLFEPVMAPSQEWEPYHPGVEITRSRALLPPDRNRFDE